MLSRRLQVRVLSGAQYRLRGSGIRDQGSGFKLIPDPRSPKLDYGERSSVGRAPDCDSGRRGFESHRSPQPGRSLRHVSGAETRPCRCYQTLFRCESGGIGRRAGFRFQWGNLWEFESPLSHTTREQGTGNREQGTGNREQITEILVLRVPRSPFPVSCFPLPN